MQSQSDAPSLSSVDVRVNDLTAATFPLGMTAKPDWKRTGAIAGAAVTSAGMVMPLAGEQAAIAYEGDRRDADVVQRVAGQETVVRMASALRPQAGAIATASFSSQEQTGNAAVATAKISALLAGAQDGSLTLAYPVPDGRGAGQVQAVVSELVDAARANAVGRASGSSRGQNVQARQGRVAELAVSSTADSGLFVARQKVQEAQQRLAEFEAERGQQNMAAYRNVLTSRMTEIVEQGSRLSANVERNQRLLTQLKLRLLTVDADVTLPDLILASDGEYQAAWLRLQQAEQGILEEFSAANVDGTRLNEIYGDYKHYQQQLAGLAEQAFPNYVMSGDGNVGFLPQAPSAIDIMQNLVVATHQDRVQQMRQRTLDAISQRLTGRHSQLKADIGEYEQLQRELETAREVVAEYEQSAGRRASVTRAQLVSDVPVAPPAEGVVPIAESDVELGAESEKSAVTQAQLLAPFFANGTLPKTLLGIAVSAGALATAAAHRSRKRTPSAVAEPLSEIPQVPRHALHPVGQSVNDPLEDFSIAPAAAVDFSSFSLYGEAEGDYQVEPDVLETVLSSVEPDSVLPISTDELLAELLEITRGDKALSSYQSAMRRADTAASRADVQSALSAELSEIVEGASVALKRSDMPELTAESIEAMLGVEVMVNELEEIISAPGPALVPSQVLPSKTTLTEPIKLSVKEIDLFAEQVVRWVLNDLGFKIATSKLAAE